MDLLGFGNRCMEASRAHKPQAATIRVNIFSSFKGPGVPKRGAAGNDFQVPLGPESQKIWIKFSIKINKKWNF